MNILEDLNTLFKTLNIPVETGKFSEVQPETFAVLTPISDELGLYADNEPQIEIQAARISVFTKGNYILLVRRITTALLEGDFSVTERRFVEYESDTKYNHYTIDCEKIYFIEGDEENG